MDAKRSHAEMVLVYRAVSTQKRPACNLRKQERDRVTRPDAKLRYVVIYGAACSYCLGRAERLDGSYLRTFALELKEQLAQTLTTFVTSILTEPHRPDEESATEPSLRQTIDVLQQVMCTHDAEKLAISVLETYEGGVARRASSSILSYFT
jgi:hypothetical protein